MKVTQTDDRIMIQQAERAKRTFERKMKMLLHAADDSGDGMVCKTEFAVIMRNPKVAHWLRTVGVSVKDPEHVFELIDKEGHGELTEDRLIAGMAQLKGPSTQLSLQSLIAEVGLMRR